MDVTLQGMNAAAERHCHAKLCFHSAHSLQSVEYRSSSWLLYVYHIRSASKLMVRHREISLLSVNGM